ncbi:MAG: hypothetical protein ABSG48_01675 [Geobacteraceae bacterium]
MQGHGKRYLSYGLTPLESVPQRIANLRLGYGFDYRQRGDHDFQFVFRGLHALIMRPGLGMGNREGP